MQEFDVDSILTHVSWTPSYELNDIISISKYDIKIKKIIEDKKYGIKYEIEIINIKYKIINIIVFEEEILDEDIYLIKLIEKKIKEKKFEIDFTKKVIDNIYKI